MLHSVSERGKQTNTDREGKPAERKRERSEQPLPECLSSSSLPKNSSSLPQKIFCTGTLVVKVYVFFYAHPSFFPFFRLFALSTSLRSCFLPAPVQISEQTIELDADSTGLLVLTVSHCIALYCSQFERCSLFLLQHPLRSLAVLAHFFFICFPFLFYCCCCCCCCLLSTSLLSSSLLLRWSGSDFRRR